MSFICIIMQLIDILQSGCYCIILQVWFEMALWNRLDTATC